MATHKPEVNLFFPFVNTSEYLWDWFLEFQDGLFMNLCSIKIWKSYWLQKLCHFFSVAFIIFRFWRVKLVFGKRPRLRLLSLNLQFRFLFYFFFSVATMRQITFSLNYARQHNNELQCEPSTSFLTGNNLRTWEKI